jgi:general secretion pathway protein B
MSLILEALKKSERQRRLGESPSIGSPIMAVRRRRSLLPVLVVLIAIALVGLWWMRRASEAPPSEAAAVPAGSPAQKVASKEEAASPPARSAITFDGLPPSANPAAETAQGSAATRVPRSKVAPDATAGMRPDLREKVKSGELVVANPQLLKPGQPATIKESEPQPASANPDAVETTRAALAAQAVAVPPPPPPDAAGSRPARSIAPARTPPRPEATAAAQGNPTVSVPVAGTAPADAIKLIWELPYAVRRELPEIKLTMHVYANAPENRFVIVNDARHVEGDDIDGMKIVEIRSDGVVFEREGQRFLYPRGGR